MKYCINSTKYLSACKRAMDFNSLAENSVTSLNSPIKIFNASDKATCEGFWDIPTGWKMLVVPQPPCKELMMPWK